MSPKSTAATPNLSGSSSKSLPRFSKRCAKLSRFCQTPLPANCNRERLPLRKRAAPDPVCSMQSLRQPHYPPARRLVSGIDSQEKTASQGPPRKFLLNLNLELIARRRGLHVAPGINRRIIHSNFVVYVRPG